MNIHIDKFRLTCVWTDLLAPSIATMPDDAPMAFLRRRSSYEDLFALLREGRATGQPSLSLPWKAMSRQRFWTFYAEETEAQSVTPQQAWKLLIPVRVTDVFDSLTDQPDVYATQEGFIFPFGTAYVLSFYIEPKSLLEGAVDRAIELRHERVHTVAGEGARVDILTLARRSLGRLREIVLGPAAATTAASQWPITRLDPRTLVSFSQASGTELLMPLAANLDLQRALVGMTRLSRSWRIDALPPLTKALVSQTSRQPLEHAMLANDRGRCVWQPHDIQSDPVGAKRSNCYHRNLVFATLQVQSLLGLMSYAAKSRDKGVVVAGPTEDCIRYAAGLLGRIYGGADATYRTTSARRHIEDSGMKDIVDQVRSARAMPPLAA